MTRIFAFFLSIFEITFKLQSFNIALIYYYSFVRMFWQGGAKKRMQEIIGSRMQPNSESIDLGRLRIARTDEELLFLYYHRMQIGLPARHTNNELDSQNNEQEGYLRFKQLGKSAASIKSNGSHQQQHIMRQSLQPRKQQLSKTSNFFGLLSRSRTSQDSQDTFFKSRVGDHKQTQVEHNNSHLLSKILRSRKASEA